VKYALYPHNVRLNWSGNEQCKDTGRWFC